MNIIIKMDTRYLEPSKFQAVMYIYYMLKDLIRIDKSNNYFLVFNSIKKDRISEIKNDALFKGITKIIIPLPNFIRSFTGKVFYNNLLLFLIKHFTVKYDKKIYLSCDSDFDIVNYFADQKMIRDKILKYFPKFISLRLTKRLDISLILDEKVIDYRNLIRFIIDFLSSDEHKKLYIYCNNFWKINIIMTIYEWLMKAGISRIKFEEIFNPSIANGLIINYKRQYIPETEILRIVSLGGAVIPIYKDIGKKYLEKPLSYTILKDILKIKKFL